MEQEHKQLVIGILAHVDSGKTTLSEALLYGTGTIRKLGRVDHKDAFLDTDALEKARGITIFSKQALFTAGNTDFTLLDTPGHVDFSTETERTLQVLDYAVLVISGADGVQGHVETLWRLLSRYQIPTVLFINKMDQEGTEEDTLLLQLQKQLNEHCIKVCSMPQQPDSADTAPGIRPLGTGTDAVSAMCTNASDSPLPCAAPVPVPDFWENVAMCQEDLLERYLDGDTLTWEDAALLVKERKLFPCFFGSALKVCGVDALLSGLSKLMKEPEYTEEFGARVFKITRDETGKRLTHMKLTGGSLFTRQSLRGQTADGQEWEEKADQIRIYNGSGYEQVQQAAAGEICSVTGLSKTYAGEGLGAQTEPVLPLLEPVLTYQIELPPDCDAHTMLRNLRQLEEEEPELSIVWEEASSEICAQVMGEVQMEILKNQIRERFGVPVSFGQGSIVYRETIAAPVEGVGHFEPLRHYAEVHLLLEPLERGMGLQFESAVSEDVLDRNWQRLVLTHLEEKRHKGVLCGAEITDMKITLVNGRAHIKHTEGGDFRQATYRALRQGLMRAQNVLLEPVYSFRLEIPQEQIGRAMTDIQRMNGTFEPPQTEGEFAILCGSAPVACMRGYQQEVTSYSRGRGKLFCTLQGYAACHNAEEVMAAAGYDPEADLENPPSSVFCAHGAGFVVPWDQVEEYMHLEAVALPSEKGSADEKEASGIAQSSRAEYFVRERKETPETFVSEEELEEIFKRTYYQNSEPKSKKGYQKRYREEAPARRLMERSRAAEADRSKPRERYLLVDGYNILFAWDELKELSRTSLDTARHVLMNLLCNYQGYRGCNLILVFDAYKVPQNLGMVEKYHNIFIVYTQEAETADSYIERVTYELRGRKRVRVATSDNLEQLIILGHGAVRVSAKSFHDEVMQTQQEIERILAQNNQKNQ